MESVFGGAVRPGPRGRVQTAPAQTRARAEACRLSAHIGPGQEGRPMTRRLTCTYHCSGCDSHFHSLAAFDAHRKGDHSTPDSRWCEEPDDMPELVALG